MDPIYPVLPGSSIDDDVYVGFWVNRSVDKFAAATLTLDQRWWNIFISFIALFVAATARSIWKLVRFWLHLTYFSAAAEDGVYHQRQAVLRNTSLATDAAMQALQISHVWRHRAPGRFGGRSRALALLAAAMAVSLLTTAASFFSSELFKSSPSEVLIAGRHCGTLPFGYPPDELAQGGRVMDYNSQKSWEDYTYAARCYRNASNEDCNKYVQPALPYTSYPQAECPFATEMCKLTYGNLLLDTGEIDSVKHLGLNKGPRFTFRYRTHCAPLVTQNHTSVEQLPNSTRKFIYYNYGTRYYGAGDAMNGKNTRIYWVEYDDKKYKLEGRTYRTSYIDHYNMDFIPQMTKEHSMVSLVFLDSDLILYNYKTDDPWFSATTPVVNLTNKDDEIYFSDEPVGVLGCSTQRFFCNPEEPGSACTNSLSRNKSALAIQKAWPNPKDQQQLYPLLAATYQFGIGKGQPDAFYSLSGAPVLLARNTMTNNRQVAKLPSNQWQLEREHIFTTTLASFQSSLVAYARGSWYGHLSCNPDLQCERVCHSQRVRLHNFHSFSAWTLFIVLTTGIIILLIAVFMEEIFGSLLEHTPLGKREALLNAFAEWQAGSTLQIQRIAHENLDLGTMWKRADEGVPVTNKGAVLGVLDMKDRKHVRLIKPVSDTEMAEFDDQMDDVDIRHSDGVEGNNVDNGNDARTVGAGTRGLYLRLPSTSMSD